MRSRSNWANEPSRCSISRPDGVPVVFETVGGRDDKFGDPVAIHLPAERLDIQRHPEISSYILAELDVPAIVADMDGGNQRLTTSR